MLVVTGLGPKTLGALASRSAARKGEDVAFWDWLRRKPSNLQIADDTIWLSVTAKCRGICRQVQQETDSNPLVLLVTHFPDTLAHTKDQLRSEGMEHAGVDRCLSPAELSGILSRSTGPRLFLVPAEVLAPDDFPGIVSEDSGEVRIVVGERHFLRSADEEIVRFAGSLNHPCRLAFHLSLDEPLMRLFVGDWVRNMLSGLGMTESNPISNPMITRRIKAAQAGLAKQVTDERKAASAQEWLRLNLPENAETSSGD